MSQKFTKLSARPELAASMGGALLHIKVSYEDEHVLCVEKPYAMHSVVHEAEDPLTVADCIADYCPSCINASDDLREAGLFQRLDYYTSGILLAAKSKLSWQQFRLLMKNSEIRKSYVALVEGEFPLELREINCFMTESRNKKRVSVVRDPSETRERCFATQSVVQGLEHKRSKSGGTFSLVRVSGMQMRRHQVRAHLAFTGHPLVGDELYGATTQLKDFLGREGFFLHAESMHLIHPFTSEPLELLSEPAELRNLK